MYLFFVVLSAVVGGVGGGGGGGGGGFRPLSRVDEYSLSLISPKYVVNIYDF